MSTDVIAWLYVASYDGNITTLSLSKTAQDGFRLKQEAVLPTGLQSPSWLTLSRHNSPSLLYALDEATFGGSGTIVSYTTQPLKVHRRLEAPQGGCHMAFYNSGRNIAVAHYTGGAVLTYSVDGNGHLELLQTLSFDLMIPGPREDRQEASHPHQCLVDPTGGYVLVPDLGADVVRVFAIDVETGKVEETAPLVAKPGSGPRHGVFARAADGMWILYLAEELSVTVSAWKVEYSSTPDGGMVFTPLNEGPYNNLGPDGTATTAMTIAEIALAPPGDEFLLISNRGDLSCGTADSITTWRRGPDLHEKETLEFDGLFSVGGSFPRHFEVNRKGDLVAVGLQKSEKVVILQRDLETGGFLRQVAEARVTGEVTCVVWDE